MDNYQNYLIEVEALLNCKNSNDCFDRIREIVEEYDIDEEKVNQDFTDKLESMIKQELISMANQPVTRRNFNYAKLLNQVMKFIPDRKRAEDTINTLSLASIEPELHTLDSLFKLLENEKSKYYVEGLFKPGLYLIAGYAKTGKSLLAYDCETSLIQGTPFLNRRTQKTNVLMIQNEEALRGSGQRLKNSRLQDFYLEQPKLYEELIKSKQLIVVKGYDLGTDFDKIFKIIDDNNIGAVFVDSLRASIAKSNLTEMDIGTFQLMYKFQSEIHKRDMLGVVIHHSNKNSNPDNPMKSIGGHNGLVGATDGNGILVTNNYKLHDGLPTIDFLLIPRDGDPCKLNIVYKEGEARWGFDVLEDTSLSESYLNMMRDILIILQGLYEQWLEECPTGDEPIYSYSSTKIANELGVDKKELIKCLNDMVRYDAIVRVGKNKKWVYHIPEGGSPMYYLVEEIEKRNEMEEKQNELDKQFLRQILKCNTLHELEVLYSDLDEEDKSRIREKRSIEHEAHIFKLRHPQKFNVGDRVYCVGFPDEDAIRKFGVRTIVDVQLIPPAKNSGDKFNESCWTYFVNDFANGLPQNYLEFETEYISKFTVANNLEKIFNESPDEI